MITKFQVRIIAKIQIVYKISGSTYVNSLRAVSLLDHQVFREFVQSQDGKNFSNAEVNHGLNSIQAYCNTLKFR